MSPSRISARARPLSRVCSRGGSGTAAKAARSRLRRSVALASTCHGGPLYAATCCPIGSLSGARMEAGDGHHWARGDLVRLSRREFRGNGARLQGNAAGDGRAIPRSRPVRRCDAGGGGTRTAVVRRRPRSHHQAQSARHAHGHTKRRAPHPLSFRPYVRHSRLVAHGLDRPLLRQQAEPVPRHRAERHGVLMQNLERAYADDIRIRYEDEKNPMEGVAIAASEYTKDGVVYEKNGVVVTAFEVDHGPLIKPAYGYRIDYDGRSVIISGDTRYSENLEKHAQGATLVIHEVAIANQDYYDKTPIVRYIMAHHITPQEAGSLFARLKPKLAAYTHLVFLGSPAYPAPAVADLERKTREKYSGPLALGTDLMAFDVRKDQVIVIPDASKK